MRFNQLQAQYEADGLEVVSVNHADSDGDITGFITANGVIYRVARVADDSGYTIPMYGTVFAIDRDGRLLWTGNASLVTDAMVETWLASAPAGDGDGDDNDEGCAASARSNGFAPLALLVLALLGCGGWSRRGAAAENRSRRA